MCISSALLSLACLQSGEGLKSLKVLLATETRLREQAEERCNNQVQAAAESAEAASKALALYKRQTEHADTAVAAARQQASL